MEISSEFADGILSNHLEVIKTPKKMTLVTGTTPRPEDVRWQGYDTADIYAAQDDCLTAIQDGKALKTSMLQRIPPLRAVMLAHIAKRTGTGLEQGTYEQVRAEAQKVTENGKLGDWWLPGKDNLATCYLAAFCNENGRCMAPANCTNTEKGHDV